MTPLFKNLGRGLGLRREHYRQVIAERPAVGWFEVISENFMVPGGNARRVLETVRRDYPIVLHGVSLSIGSTDPLNERYLDELDALARAVEPAWISDHLSWGSAHGIYGHDLLPVPCTEEALGHIARRVDAVQTRLGRRILLENPSSYMQLRGAEMSEAEFLGALARRADCGILLDVNNVYVSAHNHARNPQTGSEPPAMGSVEQSSTSPDAHDFDARSYFDALPAERIGQIHLAGHTEEGNLLIDTHDGHVRPEVWQLYAEAIERFGARATMIEWDANVPAFEELQRELDRAGHWARLALERSAEVDRAA